MTNHRAISLADLERRSELGTVKLDLEKQAELSTSLSNYTRNVGNFSVQVHDLPDLNRKKGLWEIRAQQLANECERLRISFSKFLARLDELEREQRKQLLDGNRSKGFSFSFFFLIIFPLFVNTIFKYLHQLIYLLL